MPRTILGTGAIEVNKNKALPKETSLHHACMNICGHNDREQAWRMGTIGDI